MKDNNRVFFLGAGILLLCFAYLFSGKFSPNSPQSEALCNNVILLVVGFYFGSSLGSKRNADTLRELVNPTEGTTTVTTKSPTPEGQENKID